MSEFEPEAQRRSPGSGDAAPGPERPAAASAGAAPAPAWRPGAIKTRTAGRVSLPQRQAGTEGKVVDRRKP